MSAGPVPPWASAVLDELLRLRVIVLADLDAMDSEELAAVAVGSAYLSLLEASD